MTLSPFFTYEQALTVQPVTVFLTSTTPITVLPGRGLVLDPDCTGGHIPNQILLTQRRWLPDEPAHTGNLPDPAKQFHGFIIGLHRRHMILQPQPLMQEPLTAHSQCHLHYTALEPPRPPGSS